MNYVRVGLSGFLLLKGAGIASAQTAQLGPPAAAVAPSPPVGPPVQAAQPAAPAGPAVQSAPAVTTTAKPAALAGLEAMVTNLGYATTDAADNQSFSITWVGKYNYVIQFDVSTDNTLGYAFVQMATYTPQQLASLNYVKLLEQDDAGDFFYSAEHNSDGSERLYANAILPLSGLSPTLLRGLLTGMANKMDAADKVWNAGLW
jgi:hypothetical protein